MAAHLRERGIRPDSVLCSTAARARETLAGLAAALGWPDTNDKPQISYLDELYLASQNEITAEVSGLEDSVASAMVIGHNPGLEVLAIGLAGGGSDRDAFEALERKYPTAALSTFTFDLDHWRGLGSGEGRLTGFVMPSKLRSASQNVPR